MMIIITIAPDRQTAKGRFRGMLFGGWHDDFLDAKPDFMPQQFMEAGIYENDYVRENGVWKIKRLDYKMQWQGNYEEGWAHTTSHLQPAEKLYPEDPVGPDRRSRARRHVGHGDDQDPCSTRSASQAMWSATSSGNRVLTSAGDRCVDRDRHLGSLPHRLGPVDVAPRRLVSPRCRRSCRR